MASQLNIGEEASDGPLSERPMSNLEKVQFIVGFAILRPSLRSVPTSPYSGYQPPHWLSGAEELRGSPMRSPLFSLQGVRGATFRVTVETSRQRGKVWNNCGVGIPIVAQQLMNLISIHEDEGLILGLAQWIEDPALP